MDPKRPKRKLNETESPKAKRRRPLHARPSEQPDMRPADARYPAGPSMAEPWGPPQPVASPSTFHLGQQHQPAARQDGVGGTAPSQMDPPPVVIREQTTRSTNNYGFAQGRNHIATSGSGSAVGAGQVASTLDRRVESNRVSTPSLMSPNSSMREDDRPRNEEASMVDSAVFVSRPYKRGTYRKPPSPEGDEEKTRLAIAIHEDNNYAYQETSNDISSFYLSQSATAYPPTSSWPYAYGALENVAGPSSSTGAYGLPAQWLGDRAFDKGLNDIDHGSALLHVKIEELTFPSEPTLWPSTVLYQQDGASDVVEANSQAETPGAYTNSPQLPVTARAYIDEFPSTRSSYATSPVSSPFWPIRSHISNYSSLENALSDSSMAILSSSSSAAVSASSSSSPFASASASTSTPLAPAAESTGRLVNTSSSSPRLDSTIQLPTSEIMGNTNTNYAPTVSAGTSLSLPSVSNTMLSMSSTPSSSLSAAPGVPSRVPNERESDLEIAQQYESADITGDHLPSASSNSRASASASSLYQYLTAPTENEEELDLEMTQQCDSTGGTNVHSPSASSNSGTSPSSSPYPSQHLTVPTASSSSNQPTAIPRHRPRIPAFAILTSLVQNMSSAAFAGLISQSFMLLPRDPASHAQMLHEAAQRHGIAPEDVEAYVDRMLWDAFALAKDSM